MKIGSRQREKLDRFVSTLLGSPETIRVQIVIQRWRRFTREQGGGAGMPITLRAIEGQETIQYEWIATCTQDYTALERGSGFAHYLIDAGCPRDRITLSKERR